GGAKRRGLLGPRPAAGLPAARLRGPGDRSEWRSVVEPRPPREGAPRGAWLGAARETLRGCRRSQFRAAAYAARSLRLARRALMIRRLSPSSRLPRVPLDHSSVYTKLAGARWPGG